MTTILLRGIGRLKRSVMSYVPGRVPDAYLDIRRVGIVSCVGDYDTDISQKTYGQRYLIADPPRG